MSSPPPSCRPRWRRDDGRTATIPYSAFTPTLRRPAARITAADVVLFLRYIGGRLTGVLQATQFDQTDGTDPVTGTMVAVAHDKTLSDSIRPR